MSEDLLGSNSVVFRECFTSTYMTGVIFFFSINGLSNTTVISSKIGATATLTTLLTTLETISEGVKT